MDIEPVGLPDEDTFQSRGFFSKIWLWALPLHSVIYIDTDMLVLKSLDHLFQECEGSALAAVPDSQPHMDGQLISQTGLFFMEPSPAVFADLWEICCGGRRPHRLDEWKQLEQGLFTAYFDDGEELSAVGGGCGLGWRELQGGLNFCVRYCQRPLYDGLDPNTAHVVHFACAKPWDPSQMNYAPPAYVQLYLSLPISLSIYIYI